LRGALLRTIPQPRNAEGEIHDEDRHPADDERAPGPALRALHRLGRALDIRRRLGPLSNPSEKLVPLRARRIFEVFSRRLCLVGRGDEDQLRTERLLAGRWNRHRARLSPGEADSLWPG
jgi:hypothetical protein